MSLNFEGFAGAVFVCGSESLGFVHCEVIEGYRGELVVVFLLSWKKLGTSTRPFGDERNDVSG